MTQLQGVNSQNGTVLLRSNNNKQKKRVRDNEIILAREQRENGNVQRVRLAISEAEANRKCILCNIRDGPTTPRPTSETVQICHDDYYGFSKTPI
jgi:hypothetical protein